MTIFAVPTPAGTPADLRAIAHFLEPDAPPELEGRLRAIVISLLVELHAEDKRGVKEERERYESIATLARQLQEKLAAVAWPGMLLNPLGRTRAVHEKQPPQQPNNFDIAYALCSTWGKDAHPLFLVSRTAENVAASLPGGAGKATLHVRIRGDAFAVFARVCAELLLDVTGKPPAIYEDGELAGLMSRLWRYAVGTNEPEPVDIGRHAKTAAGKLRKKIRVRIGEN